MIGTVGLLYTIFQDATSKLQWIALILIAVGVLLISFEKLMPQA